MFLTYGVSRWDRIVWKFIVLGNLAYQRCSSLPVRKFFTEECMEYGTRCIKSLQFILNIQCIKNIWAVFYRQMGTVGIIRSISFASGCTDIRPALTDMFCKTICRRFCRSRLQIKQFARIFFLISVLKRSEIKYSSTKRYKEKASTGPA